MITIIKSLIELLSMSPSCWMDGWRMIQSSLPSPENGKGGTWGVHRLLLCPPSLRVVADISVIMVSSQFWNDSTSGWTFYGVQTVGAALSNEMFWFPIFCIDLMMSELFYSNIKSGLKGTKNGNGFLSTEMFRSCFKQWNGASQW